MNRLVVSGAEAKDFVSHSRLDSGSGDFSFSALVPEPVYDNDEQWYDWRNSNWGVKWDVSDAQVEYNADSVIVSFETPWNAPFIWLDKVAKMYPELTFCNYAGEPGMNFHEELVYQNGRLVSRLVETFEDNGDFWGFPEDMFE
jgi:hypothetical protein